MRPERTPRRARLRPRGGPRVGGIERILNFVTRARRLRILAGCVWRRGSAARNDENGTPHYLYNTRTKKSGAPRAWPRARGIDHLELYQVMAAGRTRNPPLHSVVELYAHLDPKQHDRPLSPLPLHPHPHPPTPRLHARTQGVAPRDHTPGHHGAYTHTHITHTHTQRTHTGRRRAHRMPPGPTPCALSHASEPCPQLGG